MKKNININLFGTLYNIDEDAYNLLESYLQSMERYFGRQEGGEEIADDIEHRVAELLWQRREAGMEAVNIDVVREIIDTIGNAEEICDAEGSGVTDDADSGSYNKMDGKNNFKESFASFAKEARRFTCDTYEKGCHHVNTHHFFRRMDDKVLGGVCSGMVPYFGVGDALIWRLSAVLATFLLGMIGIGLIIPIIYIVLWLLAPVAATPEDRLRQQGKDITPENLAQQVMDESQQPIVQQDHRGIAGGCLKAILIFLGVSVLIPFFLFAVALVLAIVMVGGIGTAMIGGLFGGLQFFPEFSAFVATCQPMFLTALVCGLLVVVIPVSCILHFIRGGKKLGASVVVFLIVLWLLAVGLGIACTVGTCIKADEWDDTYRDQKELNANMKTLRLNGWQLLTHDNLDSDFADERSRCFGLPGFAFNLDVDDWRNGSYIATFEKDVNITEEGSYVFISLTSGSDPRLTYSFSYLDGGTVKYAVIDPSLQGMRLGDMSFESACEYNILPHPELGDSISWEELAFSDEQWVLHKMDISHVDAGSYKITINANECSEAVKIRDIRVIKR